VLFLLTTDEGRLLPTIRSRAVLLRCASVADSEISRLLKSEGASSEDVQRIVPLSFGAPGRALRYLRDTAAFDTMIDERRTILLALHQSLAVSFSLVAEPSEAFIESLTLILRDIALMQQGAGEKIAHLPLKKELEYAAQHLDPQKVSAALASLGELAGAQRFNINTQLYLENILVTL